MTLIARPVGFPDAQAISMAAVFSTLTYIDHPESCSVHRMAIGRIV